MVPQLAAAGLRLERPRALPRPAHARLHGGQPGPQDEQVARQRHRPAGREQEARRRDHPPVGGRQRLFRRHRRRRENPRARGRRLPPHPQHPALPAGQPQRLRRHETRRAAGRIARDRPLGPGAHGAVPGRGAGPLRTLRVPPRGGQAAGVLLRRPGRLLPRRAEGPPLHQRARQPGTAQRADRAAPRGARHAALDGALHELHRRGGLARAGRRPEQGLDLLRDLGRPAAGRRGPAGQVGSPG